MSSRKERTPTRRTQGPTDRALRTDRKQLTVIDPRRKEREATEVAKNTDAFLEKLDKREDVQEVLRRLAE